MRYRQAGFLRLLGVACAMSIADTSGADAQATGGRRAADLGVVNFPVSCAPHVQAEFNRAVALLHHMTYPQAQAAFQRVATTDSSCAMAHWGIAMTLFQPLWPTRPGPKELQRGWSEVERARAAGPRTARESLFVAAAEAFFRDPSSTDYWARIGRWEAAHQRLYDGYPQDPEAAAFFALAHLATAPPVAGALQHQDRAARILLAVQQRNPEHPGAMHYLVHASDAAGRERTQLATVRRYETVAPRNPHALHMPTHIYTLLGDWPDVVRGNLAAAAAALEHPAGERGEHVSDEFPHAIEYLVYAYLQRGMDDSAAAQWTRLRETSRLQPTFKTAFNVSSIPARMALERRAWSEAAMLTPRALPDLAWDRFAWPEAVSWYAKGLGAIHLKDSAGAGAAARRLDTLEARAAGAGEDLFARNIRMLALELSAWRAHAAGRRDSAVALLRAAAALEASTPKHAVTPAPTLPATELLGDLLTVQERPREALAAYRQSLEHYPRRFNSLLGAARAARAAGDSAEARARYQQLLEVAEGGRRSELAEARAFVAQGRR
jgi:tetratricopeptide (TPR) repeat protein